MYLLIPNTTLIILIIIKINNNIIIATATIPPDKSICINPLWTYWVSKDDPGVNSPAFIKIFLSPKPNIGEYLISLKPSVHNVNLPFDKSASPPISGLSTVILPSFFPISTPVVSLIICCVLTVNLGILASNGMLVKRPLLIGNGKILIGFKKEEWERILWKR